MIERGLSGCACCRPAHPTSGIARRKFLAGGVAALGLAATGVAGGAHAQAPAAPASRRIDVHHHLAPPRWIADVVVGHNTGQRPLADWTPARSIEDMDRGGVATSITSISEPGVWYGDADAARALARECNEYAARLATDYPGRFGLFATASLPDVDGTLTEIAYALDVLKADGVCLLTSYQGKYLGDPAFAPVMDELNRRKAVVYAHPVRPDCCRDLLPDVATPVLELAHDTTRTIASLLFSGTVTRCPDIRFIFSHAGGTAPFLTERLVSWAAARKDLAPRLPDGPVAALRRLYYDTAQAAHPYALSSLMKLVAASQVVFGTDFPFVTAAKTGQGLIDYGFAPADLRRIERDNAAAMMPRFA